MNKMYLRDFVEILDEAGFDLATYGWDYLVDVLANNQYARAREAKENGFLASADSYLKAATALQDAKDRRGF